MSRRLERAEGDQGARVSIDKATRYMEYSNRYANEDEIAWFVTQGFTRKDTEEDGKTKILFSKNK